MVGCGTSGVESSSAIRPELVPPPLACLVLWIRTSGNSEFTRAYYKENKILEQFTDDSVLSADN
jgi:hypothetical protein